MEGGWRVRRDSRRCWGNSGGSCHSPCSDPGTIFALVLRNPSSCLSRKGKSGLLPAHQRIAYKPCACCFGRPFHCYEKHVRGLDFKWKLLLTAAKPQHGGPKSPSSICRGSGWARQNFLRSPHLVPLQAPLVSRLQRGDAGAYRKHGPGDQLLPTYPVQLCCKRPRCELWAPSSAPLPSTSPFLWLQVTLGLFNLSS